MRFRLLLPAATAALAVASCPGQTWKERIVERWPGRSILKVSESQFRAFAARFGDAGDTRDGVHAFLEAQYAAYGLPPPSHGWFLVPSGSARFAWQPRPGVDALTFEGAEPNGDPNDPLQPGTPTPIGCGDEGHGAITAGDSDWWRVDLATATDIVAWTGPGAGLAESDTVLELRDQNGVLRLANDDYFTLFSQVETTLPAGTWYLVVRGANPQHDTGTYTLDLVGTPPGQGRPRLMELPEPNGDPNDPITPGTPSPLVCGVVVDGLISPLGDRDWYSISIFSPTRLSLRTEPPTLVADDLYDSALDLLDASGSLLAHDDLSGPSYHSELALDLPAGSYYVVVSGYQDREDGGYQLFVDCGPPFVSAIEAPEPNGDPRGTPPGHPSPVQCGSVASGAIVGAGDADWYKLHLVRGRTVVARTYSPAGPGIADTVLELRAADGSLVDMNDDEFVGNPYSRVEHVLPPGLWYVVVRGAGGVSGAYRLDIDCRTGFAGLILRGSGCAGTYGDPEFLPRTGSSFGEVYESPVMGSTFSTDVVRLPPNAIALGLVGLSDGSFGGVSLPLDLTPFGAPGCALQTSVDAVVLLPADAIGRVTWPIEIPYDPQLVGATFHMQVAAFDAGVPFGMVLSNLASAVIGTRARFVTRGGY